MDFVKLFLDHDFSLTDLFRNHDNLLTLYMKDMKEVNEMTFFFSLHKILIISINLGS